jgi:ribosomal-protein-alanine N-acetyltransferase
MPPSTRILEDLDLAGDNVRIRPLRAADARSLFPLVHGVRPVLDWLCWQGPSDLEELERDSAVWRVVTPNGTNYRFAVELVTGGEVIGTASLRFVDHPHVGDLGYWLGVPYHGRGFGSELVALLVHLGFDLLGTPALSAEVFPGNHASERVLERNGFRLERAVPACDGVGRPPHAVACGSGTAAASGELAATPPHPLRPRNLFLALAFDRAPGVLRPTLARFALGPADLPASS